MDHSPPQSPSSLTNLEALSQNVKRDNLYHGTKFLDAISFDPLLLNSNSKPIFGIALAITFTPTPTPTSAGSPPYPLWLSEPLVGGLTPGVRLRGRVGLQSREGAQEGGGVLETKRPCVLSKEETAFSSRKKIWI